MRGLYDEFKGTKRTQMKLIIIFQKAYARTGGAFNRDSLSLTYIKDAYSNSLNPEPTVKENSQSNTNSTEKSERSDLYPP